MAFDAFIKIDGIEGESTDDQHKGWIEIIGYQSGHSMPVSKRTSSTQDVTLGRVNFGKIEWCYTQQNRQGGQALGHIATAWNLQRNCKA